MWRLVVLFAGALMVADATGFLADCDESCLDDTDGQQCPPACPTCTCVGHSASTATPLAVVVAVAPACEPSDLELPPPAAERGRLAPPPLIRPPIA